MTDQNGCRLQKPLSTKTAITAHTHTHNKKKHWLCGSWQWIRWIFGGSEFCGQKPEQSGCSSSGGPQVLPGQLGSVLRPGGSGSAAKQCCHPSSLPLGGVLIESAQQLHCRRGEEEPPPLPSPAFSPLRVFLPLAEAEAPNHWFKSAVQAQFKS